MANTLHFIYRIDPTNSGDMVTCPLQFYFEYFRQYRIMCHDVRCVDYNKIDSDDVVIIGGGGLFNYSEQLNRNINRVLNCGAKVVAWAVGFNEHVEYGATYCTRIHFEQFAELAVRDFQNKENITYMPDVTCKLPELKKNYSIRRKYGIAQHKDYPIVGFDFEKITNNAPVKEILRFIGETEIVLSNSYHMLLWAMYMGKKTVCIDPFSSRFFSYKDKPSYYNSISDKFDECVQQAQVYHDLDEAIRQNDIFFEKIKRIIENNLKPQNDDNSAYSYILEAAIQRAERYGNMLCVGDGFDAQLFIDDGNGFSEDRVLYSRSCVYGDERLEVEFEISGYPNIVALRFDPIEGYAVRCKILCATTDNGEALSLIPQASVLENGWNVFLTTDPQYYIPFTNCKKINISFEMQKVERFEIEQKIYEKERRCIELKHEYDVLQKQRDELCRQKEVAQQECEMLCLQKEAVQQACDTWQQQYEMLCLQKEAVQQASDILQQEYDILQERLSAILKSNSWKITAPIRMLCSFIKNKR